MSAPPYMHVYIADYTADVQDLTCEQDGAYWRLLRSMWRKHGYLPKDPFKLALIVGVTLEKWCDIAPHVLPLFTDCGNAITHGRLLQELRAACAARDAKKEGGKRGGAAKARNRQAKLASKDTLLLGYARAGFLEPTPELNPEGSNLGLSPSSEPSGYAPNNSSNLSSTESREAVPAGTYEGEYD